MLGMIQVINYMLGHLGYEACEVEAIFEEAEAGNLSVEDIYDAVGLEQPHPATLSIFKEKLGKWRSALWVVKMRLQEAS